MVVFDENEIKIIRELIKDPRISDNQIGIKTGIPVKTVNRKRKQLEKNNILHYYTHINHGLDGTKYFAGQQLFIVKFRHGITRLVFLDRMKDEYNNAHLAKHISFSYLGENNGKLNLVLGVESLVDADILEILNADVVPLLKRRLGEDCIEGIENLILTKSLRQHHSYFPPHNMESGKIKPDWPDEKIFVV